MSENKFNLDHFYSSFPQNEFNSLKQLVGSCKSVRHIETDNNIMSIEGIYIMTKDGHYVELLNRNKIPGIQNIIAVNTSLSPIKDESDLETIIGEKLKWNRSDQASKIPDNGSFPEDIGKDWFYAWSPENKQAEEVATGIWLIDYQNQKFNRSMRSKTFLPEDYDFKQVLRVKWSLDSQRFEAMKSMGWSTKNFNDEGDSLVISLNNPNGKPVEFEFKRNDARNSGFEAIIFEKIDPNTTLKLLDTSLIELIDENDQITLKFKEY